MAETLTGKTIAATYKTLLKAGSNNPVALASGSGSSERLVFGEDDAADVRTALYVTQDRLGIGTSAPPTQLNNNTTIQNANLSTEGLGWTVDCDGEYAAAILQDHTTGYGLYIETNGTTVGDPCLRLESNNGSTVLMTVDNDGKVGIGTASPTKQLELEQTNAAGGGTISLVTSETSVVANDYLGQIYFRGRDADTYATGAKIVAFADNTWGDLSADDDDAPARLEFYTQSDGNTDDGATARMTIDSTGNVGIGDIAPACKLEVAGAIAGKLTSFTTTGPTDNVDVSGTTMLSCNTTSSSITIGGLAGGVAGQVLYIVKPTSANDLILEHNEGGGSQEINLCSGADETVTTYGGWVLVCTGSHWFAVSSPTGAADG